ncbi:MAG: FAD synthase [Alistipes sp.]|nr:FAD synthase [Alistipes sp.]
MRIFHGFEALPTFRSPAVTVGSYDGVHLGHRALLDRLVAEARVHAGESIVVTFEPHPRIALGRAEGLRLLTTPEEKAALLEAAGIDALIVVPFDRTFSALSGAEFVERYLVGRLGARTLVAGFNHRFGHDGCDCLSLPEGLLKVVRVEACYIDGQRVSSTLIRRLLDEGRRTEAERLLGHPASY